MSFQLARDVVRKLKYEMLFSRIRTICSTEIQRIWRGYSVRKFISSLNLDRTLLCWRWGSRSNDIFVAGEFSKWQKWRMTWCPAYGDHRITLPVSLSKSKSSVQYKFIVDGLWTCDGSLPMEEDSDGNVNNVISLRRRNSSPSTPVLQRRAISFPRLPRQRSLVLSAKSICSLNEGLKASGQPGSSLNMNQRSINHLPPPLAAIRGT